MSENYTKRFLWRCLTRSSYRYGTGAGQVQVSGPVHSYYLTSEDSVESLRREVSASGGVNTSIELLLPAEFLGVVGNGGELVDVLAYEAVRSRGGAT